MNKQKESFISKFFKFLISTVVLSALVVGIAFGIKAIYSLDSSKLLSSTTRLLTAMHLPVEEEKVGEVAGKVIERISDTNISAASTSRLDTNENSDKKLSVEIAIIADVQEDLASLTRSLEKVKERNINKVIVIGDLTNYGEKENIKAVKEVLDSSGLYYYVLPGDHDLAASLNADNFVSVFNKENFIVDIENYKFLFLNNSANFTTLVPSTLSWFSDEVKDADFVILSQPLYTDGLNLPFSKMFMGSTREAPSEDLQEKQSRVYSQRNILLEDLRKSQVSAVFGADHHKSNKLVDPERPSLSHYTLGAIASEVNDLPQRLLQSPRLSILNIYDDSSYDVEELLLD